MTASSVTPSVEISVIVPVGTRQGDLVELYGNYCSGLRAVGRRFEAIFVLDGPQSRAAAQVRELMEHHPEVTMLQLTRQFGEATSLMAGFERAVGSIILTLPAYEQIESADIAKLVAGLNSADLCLGHRSPRRSNIFDSMRRAVFHQLVSGITGSRLRDLGCGARAMRRRVLEEIPLYGEQHRFLAVLANRQGFRVNEIDLRQSSKDHFAGHYTSREYARSLIDMCSVFFLVRFTKRPLRFFGMIGVTTLTVGLGIVLYLVVDRLIGHHALADRPALILSSLLVVLGLQLFALGLLGELIIFTHAKNIKDYQIAEVVEFPSRGPSGHNTYPDRGDAPSPVDANAPVWSAGR
jgi:glycosyltransferase involved in cell wall biosynthesis